MSEIKPAFYQPSESEMLRFFWEHYFAPIVEEIGIKNVRNNAVSDLIDAIKTGKIQYADGTFTGHFNAATSRELSKFATFDKRSRTWKGNPPPAIKSAGLLANAKRKELVQRLNLKIAEAEAKAAEVIKTLSFGRDLPLFAMGEEIRSDLQSVAVMPEINAQTEKRLRADYQYRQTENVVGWNPEQAARLRDMVQEFQTIGDIYSIRQAIQNEWGTSAAKARFLAMQETRLFFGALSRDRATQAGVRRYRWSTSHDERVRDEHKVLDKKIISLDDPPIVDRKTGRRAHAGEDFGCRCQKIWVLE